MYGAEQVLYLSLEQFDHLSIRSQESLIAYFQQFDLAQTKVVAIDEIQLVEGRSEVINGIHAQYPGITIILTGSNSSLLSSEISTHLRGRARQVFVYPFDINEYTTYFDTKVDRKSMLQYLQETGLPVVYSSESYAQVVQEVVNSTFLKDIVERYEIRDVELLRNIFSFLVSNCGNITNLSKIRSHCKTLGYDVNLNTLGNYITYLEHSLLIYECPLYDLQGKKLFSRLRKYYIADHGLRNYLFSSFDLGTGKQLENYIYLQLKKAGFEVYTGRIGDSEIDFIAEKGGTTRYVQVAWSLDSESVYTREFGNLSRISTSRPKFVISMDDHAIGQYDGITHLQARNISLLVGV